MLTRVLMESVPPTRLDVVERLPEFRRSLPMPAWSTLPSSNGYEGIVVDDDLGTEEWLRWPTVRWLFLEGNRRPQRGLIRQAWPQSLAWQRRPFDRSKGYWLVLRSPRRSERLRVTGWRLWEGCQSVMAWFLGIHHGGKRRG